MLRKKVTEAFMYACSLLPTIMLQHDLTFFNYLRSYFKQFLL